MYWPSGAADLNPIKNVWGVLVTRIFGLNKQLTNLNEWNFS